MSFINEQEGGHLLNILARSVIIRRLGTQLMIIKRKTWQNRLRKQAESLRSAKPLQQAELESYDHVQKEFKALNSQEFKLKCLWTDSISLLLNL